MSYVIQRARQSEFVKKLLTSYQTQITDYGRLFHDSESSKHPKVPDNELSVLFHREKNLYEHLKKLDFTIAFLKAQKAIPIFEENGLKEVDYYQHVFEIYLIRLTSTLDICAKIGNEFLCDKIPNKDCNVFRYIRHKEVKNTIHSKKLQDFVDFLEKERQLRHKVIHAGDYESTEASQLDSTMHEFFMESAKEKWYKDFLKNQRETIFKDQINSIVETNRKVVDKSFEFLDCLLTQLDEKIIKHYT